MRKGRMLFFLFLVQALPGACPLPAARAQDPAPTVKAAYTGRPMKVDLSTSLSKAFYLLLVSARPGPTPTPFGNLQVGLPFWVLGSGTTGPAGKASLEVPVPADRALAGGKIYLAALFADTSGPVPRVRFSGRKDLTLSGPLALVSCGASPPMARPAVVFADLLSMKAAGEIVLPANPTQVVTDRFGTKGFVAAGKNLYVLDIPARKVSLTIRTTVKTNFTVLRRDLGGKWCFALAPGTTSLPKPSPGEVVALDMEKLTARGPITLSSQALDVVPAPPVGRAWAVTRKDRMVHLLDFLQGKILKSVQVGRKGETQAFAARAAGAALEVSTGDWGGAKPATLGSITEVDPRGNAGTPLPLAPYPSLLAPYRLGTSWFLLAACTWQGGSFTPSLHVLAASPLRSLGTIAGSWKPGANAMEASPVLPAAGILWSGNPGYPHTGFLKNGTLVLVDLSTRKVRSVLTLPKLYQTSLHAVNNPTWPAFLYCEKAGLWFGAKLRALDIPSGKVVKAQVDLGRPALSITDI